MNMQIFRKIALAVVIASSCVHVHVHAQEAGQRPSDTELALQLSDCYNGLTALDGLALITDTKVDRSRVQDSKRMARLGSASLVGNEKAKEFYLSSKTKVKAELANSLEGGTPAIVTFVQRYTDLCSMLLEQHGAYIGDRIALNIRNSSESK